MKKIIIDPGHGGQDNGAAWGSGLDYLEEDDTNLDIAFYLQYELALLGHNAILTRNKDITVKLHERVHFSKIEGADLFISIHCDAFHNTTAKGMSAHVYTHASQASKNIASRIINQLNAYFPDHVNRGVKHSNFYVLRETKMPAVLVECEFISNPGTRRFLKEPENKRLLAQALSVAINKHFSIK